MRAPLLLPPGNAASPRAPPPPPPLPFPPPSLLSIRSNSFVSPSRPSRPSTSPPPLLHRTAARASAVPTDSAAAAAAESTLTSAPSPSAHVSPRPRPGDLIAWMQEHGFPRDSKVELRERAGVDPGDPPIHYVAARESLQAGDVALFVPNSLVVTLERVLGDESIAELVTTNKLSELACLALYLMYEKKRGRDSFWFPFIQELDRQRGRGQSAVETPLLWAPEEVKEFLQGSPMQAVVEERLSGMMREYGELDAVWFLAGSLFKEYPFDIPSEAFPFGIFKQAFIAVQACIVHLQGVSIARRFALVPLGPPLLQYSSTCRAMLSAVEGGVELKVDRPVQPGDPITVWCGPQPNTRLLLNYGFVDENNPYDRLTLQAALDPKDPLYQAKRAIVQRNGKLTIQTFQLVRGKEREVVGEMLPYLRLGHISDPLLLDSISFAKGPVCGVDPEGELPVLLQLAAYFKARLDGYPTTMEEDRQYILHDASNPKKLVATRLVLIEKEILSNAVATVEDFMASMPPSTTSSASSTSSESLFPPVLS